jgi:hypothetical protein
MREKIPAAATGGKTNREKKKQFQRTNIVLSSNHLHRFTPCFTCITELFLNFPNQATAERIFYDEVIASDSPGTALG